jgi:hypothetical protein
MPKHRQGLQHLLEMKLVNMLQLEFSSAISNRLHSKHQGLLAACLSMYKVGSNLVQTKIRIYDKYCYYYWCMQSSKKD